MHLVSLDLTGGMLQEFWDAPERLFKKKKKKVTVKLQYPSQILTCGNEVAFFLMLQITPSFPYLRPYLTSAQGERLFMLKVRVFLRV